MSDSKLQMELKEADYAFKLEEASKQLLDKSNIVRETMEILETLVSSKFYRYCVMRSLGKRERKIIRRPARYESSARYSPQTSKL
jgi:hypothetical protein